MKPFEYSSYPRRYNPGRKVPIFEQLFEEKTELLKLCGCQAFRIIRGFETLAFLLICHFGEPARFLPVP